MKTLLLSLAACALIGTAAHAQTVQPEPKPQVSQAAPSADTRDISGDADKMRVLGRWSTPAEPASSDPKKNGKAGKAATSSAPAAHP